MFEFKVHKTANEIEDICVAYGVCKILNDNDIEFRLKDNKSMFSIYTEEFELDELEYYDLEEENKPWNVSSYTNNGEYKNKIPKVNNYMSENIVDIFKDLLGQEEMKVKNIPYSSLGNNHCVKSNSTPQGIKKGNENIHYLSIIGWIHGCSYVNNNKMEATMVLKPCYTDEIKKPYCITYADKETGESKILTCVSNSSEINMIARLYCETIINFNLVSTEYERVIIMYSMMTSNKPLAHKTFSLNVYDELTIDFFKDMLKTITWNSIPIDVENITSNYILNIDRYVSFSKLIRVYSKNNALINIKFKEEMLSLYSETVKNIYNNEIVIKLGRSLNRLLRDNKGYNAQIKLYTIANEKHLQSAIRNIVDEYKRVYNKNALNSEELINIINKINNKNEAKICADAIIAYSKVFIKNKDNEGDR